MELFTGQHEKANAIWSEGGTGCWEFKVDYRKGPEFLKG